MESSKPIPVNDDPMAGFEEARERHLVARSKESLSPVYISMDDVESDQSYTTGISSSSDDELDCPPTAMLSEQQHSFSVSESSLEKASRRYSAPKRNLSASVLSRSAMNEFKKVSSDNTKPRANSINLDEELDEDRLTQDEKVAAMLARREKRNARSSRRSAPLPMSLPDGARSSSPLPRQQRNSESGSPSPRRHRISMESVSPSQRLSIEGGVRSPRPHRLSMESSLSRTTSFVGQNLSIDKPDSVSLLRHRSQENVYLSQRLSLCSTGEEEIYDEPGSNSELATRPCCRSPSLSTPRSIPHSHSGEIRASSLPSPSSSFMQTEMDQRLESVSFIYQLPCMWKTPTKDFTVKNRFFGPVYLSLMRKWNSKRTIKLEDLLNSCIALTINKRKGTKPSMYDFCLEDGTVSASIIMPKKKVTNLECLLTTGEVIYIKGDFYEHNYRFELGGECTANATGKRWIPLDKKTKIFVYNIEIAPGQNSALYVGLAILLDILQIFY